VAREGAPRLEKNLVLVGGRGSGKSAISRRLLARNKHFILMPLDALIRYEAGGISIPEIVEREGWAGFRERELQVAQKVGAFHGSILADCGGGIVVDLDASGNECFSERKVAALRRHGLIVYLQRDTDYLLTRIAGDASRPALSEARSFEEIMARRDPWYRRAAHHVLECGRLDKEEIADRVLAWFYAELGIR